MQFDITRHWYQPSLSPLSVVLLPISWVFALVIGLRRYFYQKQFLRSEHVAVPVVVVGNLTVGGTGKTPLVISLAAWLQAKGYRPGIVSRGVGGERHLAPHHVMPTDDAKAVGDEALLLRETGCPLILCIHRAAAIKYLLTYFDCDIVLSDDGLQHYQMSRDIEIIVMDGSRLLGNKQLLPAGPLREPVSRLHEVDAVIINGDYAKQDVLTQLAPSQMRLQVDACIAIKNQHSLPLNAFIGKRLHAVAGIGNPERFFSMLERAGLQVIRHVFPDHYLYQSVDLDFKDELPILMTEKDAVKCHDFADDRYWYVKISAKLPEALLDQLQKKLSQIKQK